MTKTEEIYEFVLQEMEANDIEDTIENRLAFLEGIREAWSEDSDASVEKALYQIALNSEIMILKMRIMFQPIK
jgi:hypothetical protein